MALCSVYVFIIVYHLTFMTFIGWGRICNLCDKALLKLLISLYLFKPIHLLSFRKSASVCLFSFVLQPEILKVLSYPKSTTG